MNLLTSCGIIQSRWLDPRVNNKDFIILIRQYHNQLSLKNELNRLGSSVDKVISSVKSDINSRKQGQIKAKNINYINLKKNI